MENTSVGPVVSVVSVECFLWLDVCVCVFGNREYHTGTHSAPGKPRARCVSSSLLSGSLFYIKIKLICLVMQILLAPVLFFVFLKLGSDVIVSSFTKAALLLIIVVN